MRVWDVIRRVLKTMAFALAVITAQTATADTATFQVRLSGLPVGQMVLTDSRSSSGYDVKSTFRTTGVAGIVAKVRYVMRAKGSGEMPNLNPRSYAEDMHTGYRSSNVNLTFASSDARIDPMSAFYLALGSRPVAAGCSASAKTWDGTREMKVQLAPASKTSDRLICNGSATRLSGYTAKELAKARRFPLTVTYDRRGETWVPTRLTVTTIHGPVTLIRR